MPKKINCIFVCVCVCERERERERGIKDRMKFINIKSGKEFHSHYHGNF